MHLKILGLILSLWKLILLLFDIYLILNKNMLNCCNILLLKDLFYYIYHIVLYYFDIALKEAISLNPEKITILGATGTRLDHTFTTFFCIMRMLETGVDCEIIDPNNRIYFRNIDFVIRKKEQYGNFVSLVPVTESVILSIKGMKYPLENKKVFRGESLCQSNEIVNEKADISVSDGTVAVFESMD